MVNGLLLRIFFAETCRHFLYQYRPVLGVRHGQLVGADHLAPSATGHGAARGRGQPEAAALRTENHGTLPQPPAVRGAGKTQGKYISIGNFCQVH